MAITKLQPFNLDTTANYTFANVTAGNVDGANLVSANYVTGTLTTNAQPNITSVGTLTALSVTGNLTAGLVITTSNGAGTNFKVGDKVKRGSEIGFTIDIFKTLTDFDKQYNNYKLLFLL